jgi:lipoprotein-releasing system permease protein
VNKAYLFYGIRQFTAKTADKSRRRLRSAVIGIALSLIPLVTVIEVANGMVEGITRRYIEIGSYHLQLRTYADTSKDEVDAVLLSLNEIPEISLSFAYYQGLALVFSQEGRIGVTARTLPHGVYELDEKMQEYINFKEGEFDLSTEDSILVSSNVASQLNIHTGDAVKLLTARSVSNGRYILRQSSFSVTGVFSTGYNELDALSLYVNEKRGESLFKEPGSTVVGIKIKDPYNSSSDIKQNIISMVPDDWYVYTWFELDRAMYNSFRTTKILLILIMALIVCVASVNISSGLVLLVMEKERDIAILRSTGGSRRGITASFVVTGFIAGCIGTLFGIIFGLLLSANINEVLVLLERILASLSFGTRSLLFPFSKVEFRDVQLLSPSYYLENIPIVIKMRDILAVSFLSIGLSTLFAWFPAMKAGKINPVEVLQKH